jgi:NAD(P)-dependent dehydrogenase (short-subunit alcohol dehydrogenase family)
MRAESVAQPGTQPVAGDGPLAGRRALVSGGGGGIGGAAAIALAAAGAEVTLLSRHAGPLDEVAAAIRATGGSAATVVGDVTDHEAIGALLDRLPAYEIVVNAAGMNRPQPFPEVDMATFDALFSLNVRGVFSVTQHAARRLIAEKRPGVIVHVSSQMGHVGALNRTVYCGTKHAVEGFTKAMALELAPHGIRVVAVAPTWIETPFTKRFFEVPGFREQVLSDLPIGRVGRPEDVAGSIVFLCTDAASLITGTSLLIDGGWTAH